MNRAPPRARAIWIKETDERTNERTRSDAGNFRLGEEEEEEEQQQQQKEPSFFLSVSEWLRSDGYSRWCKEGRGFTRCEAEPFGPGSRLKSYVQQDEMISMIFRLSDLISVVLAEQISI